MYRRWGLPSSSVFSFFRSWSILESRSFSSFFRFNVSVPKLGLFSNSSSWSSRTRLYSSWFVMPGNIKQKILLSTVLQMLALLCQWSNHVTKHATIIIFVQCVPTKYKKHLMGNMNVTCKLKTFQINSIITRQENSSHLLQHLW